MRILHITALQWEADSKTMNAGEAMVYVKRNSGDGWRLPNDQETATSMGDGVIGFHTNAKYLVYMGDSRDLGTIRKKTLLSFTEIDPLISKRRFKVRLVRTVMKGPMKESEDLYS